jgi:hypothetical protein
VTSLLAFSLSGCSGIYYDAQEQLLGRQKRHILRSRVEAGQKDQAEAQEQFQSTLDLFKDVTKFDGGELEGFYKKLQGEYDDSEARAEDVRERIVSIEKVATDLFTEWEGEIGDIQSADLRRRSRESMNETKLRYQRYIAAMRRAEGKMEPVLLAFRDQVLFLKHNLNARAIASIQENTVEIENDVAALIRDMRRSVSEAESFLDSMQS